jgi:hypothetical protein
MVEPLRDTWDDFMEEDFFVDKTPVKRKLHFEIFSPLKKEAKLNKSPFMKECKESLSNCKLLSSDRLENVLCDKVSDPKVQSVNISTVKISNNFNFSIESKCVSESVVGNFEESTLSAGSSNFKFIYRLKPDGDSITVTAQNGRRVYLRVKNFNDERGRHRRFISAGSLLSHSFADLREEIEKVYAILRYITHSYLIIMNIVKDYLLNSFPATIRDQSLKPPKKGFLIGVFYNIIFFNNFKEANIYGLRNTRQPVTRT